MTVFKIIWIVLNIAAVISVTAACYKGHKDHELEVKRGRKPW